MSKIIVDEIQTNTVNGNVRIIPNGTGELEVTGNCSATTFSGSGASLTNLPSANLTGSIPANLLTNAGGGALEFISKTTVSSTVSQVDITGLDYGYIYKLVLKNVKFNAGGGQYPELSPFVNGATSPIINGACIYSQVTRSSLGGGSSSGHTAFQFYDGTGYHTGTEPFECSVEFSTDYRPHFRGFSQWYQSQAYSYSNVFGFFNTSIALESNVSSHETVRISGFRFRSSSGYSITSGQFLLYRYKES